uniref:FANCI_S4 domain-containing protein n=1 Tax=Echinostoma caproni TaxID=27848 RepID=A0A183B983_9TREM
LVNQIIKTYRNIQDYIVMQRNAFRAFGQSVFSLMLSRASRDSGELQFNPDLLLPESMEGDEDLFRSVRQEVAKAEAEIYSTTENRKSKKKGKSGKKKTSKTGMGQKTWIKKPQFSPGKATNAHNVNAALSVNDDYGRFASSSSSTDTM